MTIDGDELLDDVDRCANEPEDPDHFQDEDGCPDPDNDNDGVLDTSDRCVNEPGPAENKGCPDKDSDGDGVVDRMDNCPLEPGVPANQGCAVKQLVVITSERLEILDTVYFDVGKDTIKRVSYTLLDNVAAVLKAHPEIARVRIEGHTDNIGNPKKNQDLSQRRANSVMRYLAEKGVAAERLNAQGYGQQRPIASNSSERGRSKNRRVEFLLVGKD